MQPVICRSRNHNIIPFSATPETSLVVLILLRVGRENLLSGKCLLSTRCVSKGGVGGLILFVVPLLLLCRFVPPGTPWVYIASAERWLEYCLCLRVDSFFHSLFSEVQVSALGIQLGLDGRIQAFQETSDPNLLVWSCSEIKLLDDRLQVLQVGCPFEDFLLLVLGVPLELSPVGVHKAYESPRLRRKNTLNLSHSTKTELSVPCFCL